MVGDGYPSAVDVVPPDVVSTLLAFVVAGVLAVVAALVVTALLALLALAELVTALPVVSEALAVTLVPGVPPVPPQPARRLSAATATSRPSASRIPATSRDAEGAAVTASGLRSASAVAGLALRFNRHGLAALSIAPGRGRRPGYDAAARAKIVATAQRVPDRRQEGTAA